MSESDLPSGVDARSMELAIAYQIAKSTLPNISGKPDEENFRDFVNLVIKAKIAIRDEKLIEPK